MKYDLDTILYVAIGALTAAQSFYPNSPFIGILAAALVALKAKRSRGVTPKE